MVEAILGNPVVIVDHDPSWPASGMGTRLPG
jgi:hypothetical protein